jgi:lactoylglutathione lyase
MSFNVRGIFEVHLSVADTRRSAKFYHDVLNFKLAADFPDRDITFLWMGPAGSRMLGLWGPACPNPPISRGRGHFAMQLSPHEVQESLKELEAKGVTPLDFDEQPASEPVVLAWMPAVSVYFKDPDGHLLEFISMLDEPPAREFGILKFSEWQRNR